MAIVSFEVVDTEDTQNLALPTPPDAGFKENPVVVRGIKNESSDRLSSRAKIAVRQACPVDLLEMCNAKVSADKLGDVILNASVICNHIACPLESRGGGGSSGDREPRNPIPPADEIEAQPVVGVDYP